MNTPLNVAILGMGGFAANHLQQFLSFPELCRVRAVLTRNPQDPQRSQTLAMLQEHGIAVHTDWESLLASAAVYGGLDLLSIPSPIHLHAEQSIRALQAGLHVFCEKPVAGTLKEARAMQVAAQQAGRILAIGYQHLSSPSIQRIKALRLDSSLGALRKISTLVLWPRSRTYYQRASWAGKLSIDGKAVLDSPLQNAVAHYLQNMLYVAGSTLDASARVSALEAENWRGKSIEAADTQVLRCQTEEGVSLYMLASHLVAERFGPETEYLFEGGSILWSANGQARVYRFSDAGEAVLIEEFDNGSEDLHRTIVRDLLTSLHEGRAPTATIENTWQHTELLDRIFAQAPIRTVASQRMATVDLEDGLHDVLPGCEAHLRSVYEKRALLSEQPGPFLES